MKIKEILAACLLLAATGCTFTDEPQVCPYSTRIEYWYAGNTFENALPAYANSLRQYLFDEEGNLLATDQMRGDSVTFWNGELPAGRYTVVAWGNLENEETVTDSRMLTANGGTPPAYRGNTDRLYYGSATFETVDGEVCRRRIYLTQAHALLNITVEWRTTVLPSETGIFRMRLRGIHGSYGFTPAYEEKLIPDEAVSTSPQTQSPFIQPETVAAMNYDGKVTGRFVTFRYTPDTHQLWSLWHNDNILVQEIDLYKFFNKLPVDLNRSLEQEFDLLITVYDDRIVVNQVSGTDWDEGGAIG